MNNEEFVESILSRIEQLKVRAHMDWYSKQSLEDAFVVLKDTIYTYIEERPQYTEQMQSHLNYVEQVEKELL